MHTLKIKDIFHLVDVVSKTKMLKNKELKTYKKT